MVIPALTMPLTITSSRAVPLLMRSYLTLYTSSNRCLPIENFSNSLMSLIKEYLFHKKSGYMTHLMITFLALYIFYELSYEKKRRTWYEHQPLDETS
jgi:hypothetical protein